MCWIYIYGCDYSKRDRGSKFSGTMPWVKGKEPKVWQMGIQVKESRNIYDLWS